MGGILQVEPALQPSLADGTIIISFVNHHGLDQMNYWKDTLV